jgi:hypothetical protein
MFTRTIKSIVTLAAIVAVSFAFRAAPANYSGTWKLNEGKSELGEFGTRGVPSKIVVDQKTDGISITTSSTGFQGEEVTLTDNLVEGKEVDGKGSFGNATKKSTLKWAADGQGFTVNVAIKAEFGGQSFEMKGTEAWTMAADGKSVTVARNYSTPQGDFATKAVYDKQ